MNLYLRSARYLLAALAIVAAAGCSDNENNEGPDGGGGSGAQAGFAVTPLLSDQPGVAPNQDAALVNAWGLARDTQSFWIANNGSGRVLVVAPDGTPSKVAPPAAALNPGPGITGIVNNTTSAFQIGARGSTAPAQMLVASEDGKIFAINPDVAASPQLVVDRSSVGASYKGLAIATGTDGTVRLVAADFHNARIDVFDSSFQLVTTVVIADPNLRAGLAPFNVVTIGQNLYVTYAVQDAAAKDDVPGVGNGRIDVFDLNGRFLRVVLDGDSLNAPWGVVQAPSNFGPASGNLIVGNFGDGTLLAINPSSGASAQLRTPGGTVLAIDGLWGLAFGNGQNVGAANVLYFTAGPNSETHGLFGRIEVTTVTPTP